MESLAADEPKTDREWLIYISKDVRTIFKKLEEVCTRQKEDKKEAQNLQIQIDELKKWRIYQAVMLVGLIILIGGRYVFGPTSIPLVP